MSEFDVLIENARIVDGTGKAPYVGSIGVRGGKVAALGDVKGDAVKVGWDDASAPTPANSTTPTVR